MNVILDIDETFLHWTPPREWESIPEEQRSGYDVSEPDEQGNHFILRPHYKEFFVFLKDQCASVNIWTWNTAPYAQKVKVLIESKVPGLKFKYVWADKEAEAASDEYGGHKNLKYIWDQGIFSPSDTILVDDHFNLMSSIPVKDKTTNKTKYVWTPNARNGINIAPFEPGDDDMTEDTELLRVMETIKNASTGKPFCNKSSRLPRTRKAGRRLKRKTQRSKGRRKTRYV